MLMNCIHSGFALFYLVLIILLAPENALAQSSEQVGQVPTTSQSEFWFGWIDTPQQQLRTIVHVKRDKDGKATSGSIISPDQTADEVPLSNFQIGADRVWQFALEDPIDAKRIANYSGTQSSSDLVVGELVQLGQKLPLKLRQFNVRPPETNETLGADSVWLGTLDLVFRKMDFRIRVYSTPPYATAKAPRALFDSLTEKVVGIPVQVSVDENRTTTFEMKSIAAKFVAKLSEAGNELNGRFIQGPLPLPLVMKLLSEKPANKSEPSPTDMKAMRKENKEMSPSTVAQASVGKSAIGDDSPLLLDGESPIAPSKPIASSPFFVESSFEVSYGASKPKKGKEPTAAEKGTKLVGTFTLPKPTKGSMGGPYPAVVMVTGSGPQDRNETMGRHKPFERIAHYLAEIGIASLRYDDRGVGESNGDFLNATSEEFARDAIAVWEHAITIPELDPSKIGIFGHSEGGIVGPMAAVWEPRIAFLILLAPPGITGSEILKSQIDRISELQGMNEADRKATMALQGKLQDIASGYFTDETTMRRDIAQAIRENWDSLKTIAKAQDPSADLEQLRKTLTSQIEGQFQQLRLPWFRFFLSYDPSTNWMMIRCPTLAIWGGNDVQVLPEMNRAKIERAIIRNQSVDAQLTVLPGLNHLMQTSKSGLPEEYDGIEETISPIALTTIRIWAKEQGLIDR